MKILINKIYIVLILIFALFMQSESFGRDNNVQYTRKNISNYFLGVIYASKGNNNKAFKHLKKVQSIKGVHSNFNLEFIRTLVLLEKFEEAITFSRDIWIENEFFFEADLLLGLDSFLNKDYKSAEKYFERLNAISRYNIFFDDFIGNVLIAWSKASQNKKEDSFLFLEKIPSRYQHLTKLQNIFLNCHFNSTKTKKLFEDLIKNENYNFSRYNFFLANYLISNNKVSDAREIIKNARNEYSSNLLIKQAEIFLDQEKEKIINYYDCKNPRDSMAEFFYVIANLYSSEQEYQLSNFYLKISFLLNDKFLTNKALLAENFFYQKKNKQSKNIYSSLKSVGAAYSWHASQNIAEILLETKGKQYAIDSFRKEFDLLEEPNFEHYYDLANFYKQNEYYKESIKYYSLILKKIKRDHFLFPKVLDRRGTSYERLGDWDNAEKDLLQTLEILPDQPHVLNYLAYSWIDRGINLDKGLEMLKKAAQLRENDGYIIDSLGWAYYAKENYIEAEKYLQKAVELLPSDPVINDHYADALWMLNKNIQARHFWKYVLKLDETEQDLKDSVNKKLIFGINKQL